MTRKRTDLLLTIAVCSIWTLFVAATYYFTYGFSTLIAYGVFLVVALPYTIWFFSRLKEGGKAKDSHSRMLLAVSVILLFFNVFFLKDMIEKLDWQLYYSERMEIIERFKKGGLKAIDNKLVYDSFIPISNGGNEIMISESPSGYVEAVFYIDRGTLNHQTALVYTERPADIEYYEKCLVEGCSNNEVEKKANNWYRVKY